MVGFVVQLLILTTQTAINNKKEVDFDRIGTIFPQTARICLYLSSSVPVTIDTYQ